MSGRSERTERVLSTPGHSPPCLIRRYLDATDKHVFKSLFVRRRRGGFTVEVVEVVVVIVDVVDDEGGGGWVAVIAHLRMISMAEILKSSINSSRCMGSPRL